MAFQPLSWLIYVVWFLAVLGFNLGTLLFRWFVGILLLGQALVLRIRSNPGLWAALAVLVVGGSLMVEFQQETMTIADQTFECGLRPSGEIINSIAVTIFVDTWKVLSTAVNDAVLFTFEGFKELIDAIGSLVRVGKLTNRWAGLIGVSTYIFGESEAKTFAEWITSIWSSIGLIFTAIFNFGAKIVEVIGKYGVLIFARFELFSKSCTYCALDPYQNTCPIRSPPNGADSTYCDQCHDALPELVGILGIPIDALIQKIPGISGGSWSAVRVLRAFAGFVRALANPLFFILSTFVSPKVGGGAPPCIDIGDTINIFDSESLITLWWIGGNTEDFLIFHKYDCGPGESDAARCCGKPSGCIFPKDGGTDLPIGVIPMASELLRAVTDDKFVDPLEFVLSFLFNLVQQVVDTFIRIIDAFKQPAFGQCMARFPSQGLPGTTPGTCYYGKNQAGFEAYVPDGGIHECFKIIYDYLNDDPEENAPLLVPVLQTGILGFLLDNFWRYTVDFGICPIGAGLTCFTSSNSKCFESIGKLTTCFECAGTESPLLYPFTYPISKILGILNEAEKVVQAIITWFRETPSCLACCRFPSDDFHEVSECIAFFNRGDGCEGCKKKGDELSLEAFDRVRFAKNTSFDEPVQQLDLPPLEMAKWRNFVATELQVEPGSMCASVLWNASPLNPPVQWGEYAGYVACMSMYSVRYHTAEVCNQTRTRGDLRAGDFDMSDTLTAMAGCHRELHDAGKYENVTIQEGYFDELVATSSMPSFAQSIAQALQNFSFVPSFAQPVLDQLETTSLWRRTAEFARQYSHMNKVQKAPRAQLDQFYTDFANDILRYSRTGRWRNETVFAADATADELQMYRSPVSARIYRDKTPEELKAVAEGVFAHTDNLGVTGSRVSLMTSSVKTVHSAEVEELWNEINERTSISYWPSVQMLSGVSHSVNAGRLDLTLQLLTGSLKYSVHRQEFVVPAVFELERANNERTSVVTRLSTAVEGRRAPRTYHPFFPFPRLDDVSTQQQTALAANGTVQQELPVRTITSVAKEYIANLHVRLEKQRTAKALKTKSFLGHAANDAFWWSLDRGVFAVAGTVQWAVWGFDWVSSVPRWLIGLPAVQPYAKYILPEEKGTVAGMWRLRQYWERMFSPVRIPSNKPQDYLDALIDFWERWAKCSTPENIDGTEPYSPVCVMLLPENMLGLWQAFAYGDNRYVPQIQWPAALIKQDEPCETIYNGAPGLLDPFDFSNNCKLRAPVAPTTSSCSDYNGGCLESSKLTATQSLTFTDDTIEYALAENGGACAPDTIMVPIPDCTSVVSVTANIQGCVLSAETFESNATSETVGCTGAGLRLQNSNVNYWLKVTVLSTACRPRVKFANAMEFRPGQDVLISTPGQGRCALCFNTIAWACVDSQTFVDPYREKRDLCDLPGGGCDWCPREYNDCGDIGLNSIYASLAYIIMVGPRVFYSLIAGGFSFTLFESVWGATLGFSLLVITVGTLLMTVCLSLPLNVLTFNVLYIVPWTIFILFGDTVPWALLVMVAMAIVIKNMQSITRLLAFILTTMVLIIIAWILNLVFDYGSDIADFSAISYVLEGLLWWKGSVFNYLFDATPVVDVFTPFNLTASDPVPSELTFCFFWTFANGAIAVAIIISSLTLLRALVRFLGPLVLFLWATILLLFDARTKALGIIVRGRSKDNQKRSKENQSLIDRLDKRVESWIASGATKLQSMRYPDESGADDPDRHEDRRDGTTAGRVSDALLKLFAYDNDEDNNEEFDDFLDDDDDNSGSAQGQLTAVTPIANMDPEQGREQLSSRRLRHRQNKHREGDVST